MDNLLLIFICLVAGFLLNRFSLAPPKMAQALNSFVITLSLPALILTQAPALSEKLRFESDFFIAASMAWIQLLVAFLLFTTLARRLNWSRPLTGALVLTAEPQTNSDPCFNFSAFSCTRPCGLSRPLCRHVSRPNRDTPDSRAGKTRCDSNATCARLRRAPTFL